VRRLLSSGVLGIVVSLSACATPEAGAFAPVLSPVTVTNRSLRDLPPAQSRVAVAVYDYADQTGQFKTGETFQTLSKAVTQGAAAILVKALQDAGNRNWFTVIERQQLNNLLKERQIIKEMRRTYLGEKDINPQALPPLLFAGMLLEGGIVGYDTNTLTGGAGARYLGIGGDVKYRQDTVTVYLRAVSTKSGEVLVNVTAHKTIASFGIHGDAFKFVAFDKLLETEAGITKNEPDQLAIQQAIEKAVYALIMEGTEAGLWAFTDQQAQKELLGTYRAEKADAGYEEAGAEKPKGWIASIFGGESSSATLMNRKSKRPAVRGHADNVTDPAPVSGAPWQTQTTSSITNDSGHGNDTAESTNNHAGIK
jgi:curli production assembly/transport component CsgG